MKLLSKLYATAIPARLRLVTVIVLAFVTALLIISQFPGVFAFSTANPSRLAAQRLAELEDRERTLDLSLEFGFDPMIVELTRQLSAKAYRTHQCACPTWRFVNSDYQLAYLILSIVRTESNGNPAAISSTHALGLTQLLLTTARQYDGRVTEQDLLKVPKNLDIAVQHFVTLLEQYHGNPTLAVIAWNRGSGSIDRLIALGESPENGYAKMVYTRAAIRNAAR